jgi:G3E family GTPase
VKNVYVLDPLEADSLAFAREKKLDIKLADIVLINKTDLADSAHITALQEIIKEISSSTVVMPSIKANISPDIFFQKNESRVEDALVENYEELKSYGIPDHGTTYVVVEADFPLGKKQVEQALHAIGALPQVTLKRAKGYFKDSDGKWWHLEATRFHHSILSTESKQRSVLVFIGAGVEHQTISQILASTK